MGLIFIWCQPWHFSCCLPSRRWSGTRSPCQTWSAACPSTLAPCSRPNPQGWAGPLPRPARCMRCPNGRGMGFGPKTRRAPVCSNEKRRHQNWSAHQHLYSTVACRRLERMLVVGAADSVMGTVTGPGAPLSGSSFEINAGGWDRWVWRGEVVFFGCVVWSYCRSLATTLLSQVTKHD